MAIAMWVGVLIQTFIFKRTCRTKRARWYQHYFSKLLLMLITTVLQTTILALSLAALGYSCLGISFGLLYVWLLFLLSLNMQYDLLLLMGMLENI
ncbi:hypothetical protein [Spiroplasma sp. ChiS]|uniref:hypothetical protein n=1 Tax=Spiroplasma sp. ChiS TaxID=2099885 RepID=UPI001F48610C|nr:hypothetical protein [Spiroplasma sp. ChiS]